MKNAIHTFFNRVWYGRNIFWIWLLSPFGLLVSCLTQRKHRKFLSGIAECYRPPVPVIVVGNITVGGTGKTPLVIWLVKQLQLNGYRPGIVSRGYGARPPHYPYLIQSADTATTAGDEPLMLFKRTGVPVVIDPRRAQAAQALLDQTDCDVIISDDGLQHYALARTFEIIVLDGTRGTGNQHLLPAGPLREPRNRLSNVNAIVINGEPRHDSLQKLKHQPHYTMQIVPGQFKSLTDHTISSAEHIRTQSNWVAVAGIGNPERFFVTLEQLGIRFERISFPDHHAYSRGDFSSFVGTPILTTEKDSVKLQTLHLQGWYLSVEAQLQPGLIDDILATLERFKTHPHHLY